MSHGVAGFWIPPQHGCSNCSEVSWGVPHAAAGKCLDGRSHLTPFLLLTPVLQKTLIPEHTTQSASGETFDCNEQVCLCVLPCLHVGNWKGTSKTRLLGLSYY